MRGRFQMPKAKNIYKQRLNYILVDLIRSLKRKVLHGIQLH